MEYPTYDAITLTGRNPETRTRLKFPARDIAVADANLPLRPTEGDTVGITTDLQPTHPPPEDTLNPTPNPHPMEISREGYGSGGGELTALNVLMKYLAYETITLIGRNPLKSAPD